MRFDRPTMNGQYGWGLGRKTLDFHSPGLASKSPMRRTFDTNKERDFIVEQLHHQGVIANVRSHLPGERLSIGHVNRYVSDGIVIVAELQSK